MSYQWNGDTATAAAVVAVGWNTEEERIVHNAAWQHLRNVSRLHYALAKREIACPTCGRSVHPSQEKS